MFTLAVAIVSFAAGMVVMAVLRVAAEDRIKVTAFEKELRELVRKGK